MYYFEGISMSGDGGGDFWANDPYFIPIFDEMIAEKCREDLEKILRHEDERERYFIKMETSPPRHHKKKKNRRRFYFS